MGVAAKILRLVSRTEQRRLVGLCLIVIGSAVATANASQGRYLEKAEFLQMVFAESIPEPTVVFVDAELRREIESILDHRFTLLRMRYWHGGGTSAWIFDEIGKTEPITIGVGIEGGQISIVRVLEFRESRGWEVRYPFFTDQFNGAALASDASIDRSIDGITGATLSVAAVSRAARLALFMSSQPGADPSRANVASRSGSGS